MKEHESILTINNQGRIDLKDSSLFIKILYLNEQELENLANENVAVRALLNKYSKEDLINILVTYARKQINKLDITGISSSDLNYIIHSAIAKTLVDFDHEKNTNFLSFFWTKLRGEISNFKVVKERQIKRVIEIINENKNSDVSYNYVYDQDNSENHIEGVDYTNTEDSYIEKDYRKRQMIAFKMAFSNLPRIMQFILYEIANGKHLQEIADVLGIEKRDVTLYRNQGLSLIFQKILRSKHLDREEKEDLLKVHDLNINLDVFENEQEENEKRKDNEYYNYEDEYEDEDYRNFSFS